MPDNKTWLERANNAVVLEQLLDELEYQSCDLRCLNIPTGAGDYDIEWVVIEHHMAEPHEREIGRGRSVLKALKAAFPVRAQQAIYRGEVEPC